MPEKSSKSGGGPSGFKMFIGGLATLVVLTVIIKATSQGPSSSDEYGPSAGANGTSVENVQVCQVLPDAQNLAWFATSQGIFTASPPVGAPLKHEGSSFKVTFITAPGGDKRIVQVGPFDRTANKTKQC